jgi:hypothetical protein
MRGPGDAPFRGGGKNDDLNTILEEVSSSRRRSPIRADAALSEREISKLPLDAQEIARKMTSLALDLKDAKSLLVEHANGVKRGFEIGDVLGHATKLVESCSTEYDGATQEKMKECPPGDTHYCIDTGVAFIKRGKDGKATDIGQCIVPSKTFERIDARRGEGITSSVDSLKRQHNSILSLYTNLSELLKDTSQAACETLTTRGACLSPYGAQRCVFEGQRSDEGDSDQRDPRELAKEMALSGKMKYPTLSRDGDERNYLHKDKEYYPQPSDVGKCKSAMGHSYKVHEAAGVELKRLKSHVTRVENRLNGGEMKKFSSNRDSGIGNTPSMAGQRRVYEGLVAQKKKIARRIDELEGQLLNSRNELLENAYKYAFAQRMDATCQVRLSKTDTLDKCAVGMSVPEISPDDKTLRYSGCGAWDSHKGRYMSTSDLEKIENRAVIAGGRFQCRSVPAQNITWRPALNEKLEQRGIVSIGANMDASNISYESNNALAPLQHALESQPINLLMQLAMAIDKIDWETDQAKLKEKLRASDKISLARRYDSGAENSEIDELMRRGDMSDDEIRRELEASKGLRKVDGSRADDNDYEEKAKEFKKNFGGNESDEFAQSGHRDGDDESQLRGGNYVYKIGRDMSQRDFQMRMYTEAKAGSMDGDPAMRSINAARIMMKSLSDNTITAIQEHLQDNPYSETFKAEFINAVDQIASLLRPLSAGAFLSTVRRISQSTGIPVTDSGGVDLLSELKELKKRGGTFGPYGTTDVVQRIYVPGEKLVIRTKQDGQNVEWHSFVVHTNKTPNDSASSSTVGSFGSPMFVLVDVNREQEASMRSQLSKVVGDFAYGPNMVGRSTSNWTNHDHMVIPAPMFAKTFNSTTGERYNSLWGGTDAPEFAKYGSAGMEVDLPVSEVNHKTLQNKHESPSGNDVISKALAEFMRDGNVGNIVKWNKAVMGEIHADLLKILDIFLSDDTRDPATMYPPIGGRSRVGAATASFINKISEESKRSNTILFKHSAFDDIPDDVDINVEDPQNEGWSALAQVELIVPLITYLGVGNTAVVPSYTTSGSMDDLVKTMAADAAASADSANIDDEGRKAARAATVFIRENTTDVNYYKFTGRKLTEKTNNDVDAVNKQGMSFFYKKRSFPFTSKIGHALKFGEKSMQSASPDAGSFQRRTNVLHDIVEQWKGKYITGSIWADDTDTFKNLLGNAVGRLETKLKNLSDSVKKINLLESVGINPDFNMSFLATAEKSLVAPSRTTGIGSLNRIFLNNSVLWDTFTQPETAYETLGSSFKTRPSIRGFFRRKVLPLTPRMVKIEELFEGLQNVQSVSMNDSVLFVTDNKNPEYNNSILLKLRAIQKLAKFLDDGRTTNLGYLEAEAERLMSYYTIGSFFKETVEKLTSAVEDAKGVADLVKVFIGDRCAKNTWETLKTPPTAATPLLGEIWNLAVKNTSTGLDTLVTSLATGIAESLEKYIVTGSDVNTTHTQDIENVILRSTSFADSVGPMTRGLQYLNYHTMSIFMTGVMDICVNVQLSSIPVDVHINSDSKLRFKEHVAKAFFQAYSVFKADIKDSVHTALNGRQNAIVEALRDKQLIKSFNNDHHLENYFGNIVKNNTGLTHENVPSDFVYSAQTQADEFDDDEVRRVTFADDLEADDLEADDLEADDLEADDVARGETAIRLATRMERDEFDEYALSGGGHAYSDMSDQEIMTLSAEDLLTAYEKDEIDDNGGAFSAGGGGGGGGPGFEDPSDDPIGGDGIEGGGVFSRGKGAGLDNTGRAGKNRFFSNNHGRCNTETDKNTQRCFVEIPGANPVSHAEMIIHSFRCAFMLLTDYMIRVTTTPTVGNKLVGCRSADFENDVFKKHILAEFAFLADPHYIWRPGQNDNIPAKFNSYDTSKLSTPLHIKNHLVSTYWGNESETVAVGNVGLPNDKKSGFVNKPFLFKQMYSNFISAGVHSSVTNVFLQHFNAGITANGWHIDNGQMDASDLKDARYNFGIVGTSNLETAMNQATTKLNGLSDKAGNTSNFINSTLGNFVTKNPNSYFTDDAQGTGSYSNGNKTVSPDVLLNQHFSGTFVPAGAKDIWGDGFYKKIQQSMWKMNVYDVPPNGSEWKLNKVYEDFDPTVWTSYWNKILDVGLTIAPDTVDFDPAIRTYDRGNANKFTDDHPNSIRYGGVRQGDSNSAWMLSPVYVMLMVLERARKSVSETVCSVNGDGGTSFGGGYNEFISGGYSDDVGGRIEGGGGAVREESVADVGGRDASIRAHGDNDETRDDPEKDEYSAALHRLTSDDETDLNMSDDVRNALGRLDSIETEAASRSMSMEERDSVTDIESQDERDSALGDLESQDEHDSAMDDIGSAMYERDSIDEEDDAVDERDSLDEEDDAVDEEDDAVDEEDDAVDEEDDAVDEEDESWQSELNNLIIKLKSKSVERKDGADDFKTPLSQDEYSREDSGNTHYEDFGMSEFDEARIDDSRLESLKYKIPSADTVSIDSISDWKRA